MKFFVFLSGLSLLVGSATGRAQATDGYAVQTGAKVPASSERMTAVITLDLSGVPLKNALQEIARQANMKVALGPEVHAVRKTFSLRVRNIRARDAIDRVLKGTGIEYIVAPSGQLVFVAASKVAAQGVIAGKVVDVKTGKGVSGASISIGTDIRGTVTSDDGTYRLAGVNAGVYTVSVRMVGFAKQTKQVTVTEGATVTADFKLDPSANVLDQVVVTGTVIATELKAVPNAINVVTAKQIEELGITKVNQLFRGNIPGLFAQNSNSGSPLDEVYMFSRGITSLNESDPQTGAFTAFTNPIKTYVDGVELADPKYLSQIDPKSIERIEILTGPQASTIYGSNAINGVMQIFTKRGSTSRPQLTLSLLSGWVENNFSSARTPQHDYSVNLSGMEGRLSYNAGGSWNYMGPWSPAKQSTRTGGFGGARVEYPTPIGQVTADMTLNRSITQNQQHGSQTQSTTAYVESGLYSGFSTAGLSRPTTSTLIGQALGLTLSFAPISWWSHELGIGQDVSDVEVRYTSRGYLFPFDTTLRLQQDHIDRSSLRYTTTARVPVTSLAQVTVTSGLDGWQTSTSSLTVTPQTLVGTLIGATTITRRPAHNTGAFLQTQFGMRDHLFFTYGFRAEWNPNYGDEAEPNYSPRYGVAYTQEVGSLSAKVRVSYGRSTRPPASKLKDAQTAVDVFGASSPTLLEYGNFIYGLANPELAPEHQKGGEGGLELYFGTRGSFVVTRYNQTVDGLIAFPRVDSVRSLVPNPTQGFSPDSEGYKYQRQFQYLNVGSIRNQGWELQGSVITGPFTTRGTYSWTKSRSLGVSPKYRSSFNVSTVLYQPGRTFSYLPEHTWALGTTYSHAKATVTLNVTGVGQVMNSTDDFFLQYLSGSIRLPQNRLSLAAPFGLPYVSINSSYSVADVTSSYRFSPRVEGMAQVQNLTDQYTNDYNAQFATLGRQIKVGFRLR